MDIGRKLVYYGFCLLTFGTLWIVKLVIQKAVEDAGLETKSKK